MTTAYWCVLAAMCLPYLWIFAAKATADYDNVAPRDYLEDLEGWRRRAYWAHKNAFEAFPQFAAAVIIAHLLHADQQTVDLLAVTFVGARLLHGVCYIAELSTMRSLMWLIGFVCVVSMLVSAA